MSCLRGEAGDTMIEVVMAALIVALIAAAVFTGLSAAAHIAGAQRHESAAAALAQQDEQRLRGLTVQDLVASASGSCTSAVPPDGNGCYTQTIDNETYTITSTAKFYSASSGSASCTTSGIASADYIATSSVVSWQNANDGRQPIEEHSLITPSTGGQIVVAVQDNVVTPVTGLASATVTITGPGSSTATQSATTDSNGCALFAAVTAGTYSVSATIPSPYVTYGGTATQSVALANNQTQTVTFNVAQAATINASFQTRVNGTASAIPFDTFSLRATSESAAQSFGTVGTYATPPATVSTGATIYPYSSGYDAYAGNCTNDDPGASSDTAVSPTQNGTSTATINVPSMLLSLTTQGSASAGIVNDNSSQVTYTGNWGYSAGQSWDNSPPYPGDYNDDEHASDTGGSTASFTFTGTSIEWITSLDSTKGNADVYIDGTKVASSLDLYSPYRVNQVIGYAATGLSAGTHTIKIVVDGTHDSRSSDYWVSIDAFVVGSITAVNDTSATYQGSNWVHYYDGGDYQGDEHYDATAGDTASYTFTGTGIEWISNLYSNHGYADVAIDGTTVATNIDTFVSSGKTYAYPAFGDANLPYGTHTITIKVDGTHDANASGSYITVDEFIVTNAQSSSSSTSVTSWPSSWTIKTYDSCSTPVGRTLPSNPVATTVSGQTVFPVAAPYGSSFQVCVANSATGTNTGALPSGSSRLSNIDFTGTTIQSLKLPTSTTATGNSAVFDSSGSCP
jgi:hypothetical protein